MLRQPVLLIRMFIPGPGSDFFPSRIRVSSIPDPRFASKNLSILTSRKYDQGRSSRIRILTFYPSRIPDPGVKKAPEWLERLCKSPTPSVTDPDADPVSGSSGSGLGKISGYGSGIRNEHPRSFFREIRNSFPEMNCMPQCSGSGNESRSGSTGSKCFWVFRIRIH